MYSALLAVIYLAFISLGLPDSLLGAGWPVMHNVFAVPISYMGMVSMVISASTIVSSLLSDSLTRKFGTSMVTLCSVILSASALFGFSFATEFWMLIVLAVPYGLGAGAIDAALNNYVAVHYTSKHMSWLHCFWGVGAIISPFVMSYALSSAHWNQGYRIVGTLQLAIAILLLVTLPLWKANQSRAVTQGGQSVGVAGALKIKGVAFLILGFFAYCSAEATAMSWAATYFTQVKLLRPETAAAFASLVFIGLTLGRFFGGFLMDKISDRKMIVIGAVISICGILLVLLPVEWELLSLIGFAVIGLGFAPVYPCIIHSVPGNFGEENAGAIIGIQMAGAYTGNTLMPPLYGLLGKWLGYQIMPVYLLIFMVLMVCMTEKTFRITKK